MENTQARKSSQEEIQLPLQAGDYVPTGNNDNPLVAGFNGNYQDAVNYYHKQVNKLYFANIVLNNQLKTIMDQKNALAAKLAKLELQKGENGINDDKKKRHRRTAGQIERGFTCPVKPCQKSYGSQGSLSQHLKIKHNQYYKQYANQQDHIAANDDKQDSPKQGANKGESNNTP